MSSFFFEGTVQAQGSQRLEGVSNDFWAQEQLSPEIIAARTLLLFDAAEDLSRRANPEQHEMSLLAAADALAKLSGCPFPNFGCTDGL